MGNGLQLIKDQIYKRKLDNSAQTSLSQNQSKQQAKYFIRPQSKKPPSLLNYSACCYLNSALQGISSCDKFVKEIKDVYDANQDLEKLSVFHQLILILNGGKVDRMEVSRNKIFREWNKTGQQDSFELFAYVINQVYNEIRQSKENAGIIPKRDMQNWLSIPLPMRIIIEYKIRCECGSIVDVPLQSDLALHVTIPLEQDFDLQTLVNQFFNEDRIEDYKCEIDDCDGAGATRLIRLRDPLPTTICIHLQRTFWNGSKMKKIDKTIEFSKILKIKSEYLTFNSIEMLHSIKESETSLGVISDKTIKRDISNDDGDTNSVFNSDDKRTLKYATVNPTQNSPINQEANEDMFSGASAKHSALCREESKMNSEANSDIDDNEITTHEDNIDVENVKEACRIVSCSRNNVNTLDNNVVDLPNYNEPNSNSEDMETTKYIKGEDITILTVTDNQRFTETSVTNQNDDKETESECMHDPLFEKPECSTNETEAKSVPDSFPGKPDPVITKDETYHLISIIVHFGSVYGGHYVCYKYLDRRWFLTDDSQIREVSECDVLKCNPYILFYEQS